MANNYLEAGEVLRHLDLRLYQCRRSYEGLSYPAKLAPSFTYWVMACLVPAGSRRGATRIMQPRLIHDGTFTYLSWALPRHHTAATLHFQQPTRARRLAGFSVQASRSRA